MTHTEDGNGWSADGRNILSTDRMEAIRKVLENKGPVIVEHWFYYGSRAPDRIVFDDYDKFMEYLKTKARPGDAFHIWDFADLCHEIILSRTANIPIPMAACRLAAHTDPRHKVRPVGVIVQKPET